MIKKVIDKLFEKFWTYEFFKFVVVGVINTLNHLWIATLAELIYSDMIAYTTGYVLSMIGSYFLNTLWTYKLKPNIKSFIVFPMNYIPNYIIQVVVYWLLLDILAWPGFISKIIAIGAAIPATYIMMSLVLRSKYLVKE